MSHARVVLGGILSGLILAGLIGQSILLAQPPPTEVEKARAEDDAVRAEHLCPTHERTLTFRVTAGGNLDQRLPLSLRKANDDEPGDWVL